ncbi:OmpH family outer membrane protein [Cysteiniphilum halobium]|uniref:OmpH family outer membrane protein n=1 Tax=Cysteiniphilum halobium TaxID=2219059 RepID=UPI003F845978
MKKLGAIVLLVLFFCSSFAMSAFVDVNKVSSYYYTHNPKYVKAMANIEKFKNKHKSERDRIKKGSKKYFDLSEKMDAIKDENSKEYRLLENQKKTLLLQMENYYDQYHLEFKKSYAYKDKNYAEKIREQFRIKLKNTIKNIAKKEHYSAIYPKDSALYFDNSKGNMIDLTAQIIKEL